MLHLLQMTPAGSLNPIKRLKTEKSIEIHSLVIVYLLLSHQKMFSVFRVVGTRPSPLLIDLRQHEQVLFIFCAFFSISNIFCDTASFWSKKVSWILNFLWLLNAVTYSFYCGLEFRIVKLIRTFHLQVRLQFVFVYDKKRYSETLDLFGSSSRVRHRWLTCNEIENSLSDKVIFKSLSIFSIFDSSSLLQVWNVVLVKTSLTTIEVWPFINQAVGLSNKSEEDIKPICLLLFLGSRRVQPKFGWKK
jgi:hypothetical protein